MVIGGLIDLEKGEHYETMAEGRLLVCNFYSTGCWCIMVSFPAGTQCEIGGHMDVCDYYFGDIWDKL